MTRPQMIRADTMDLQSRDAPSAQDHSALHSPPPARRDLNQQSSIKAVNNTEEVRHELLTGSGQSNGIYQTNDYDLQNGNESESELLDTDEEDLMNAEADMSSTSPSIDNEDIDFEFVYALHTFQATVEGQANAVKGDTMVLLDDSNSYWWLVRIVKDSSIGYLPAEHIETPSERLARLNKHRNMDLASTMLGDTVDKPKASLGGKLLQRKKKPRNVTFTSPFFSIVEYQVEDSEDEDYQSGEEDEEAGQDGAKVQGQQQQQSQQTESVTIYSEPDEITPVEPQPQQRARSTSNDGLGNQPAMGRIMIGNDTVKTISSAEQQKKSLESERRTVNLVIGDGHADKGAALENGKPEFKLRARGNTDSAFFGDETMKISLTPAVARYQDEDAGSNTSSPVTTLSNNSSLKELGRGSLDKVSKRDDVMSPPPGKGKEKLKKTAVLAGLFSRRRKGRKSDDDDIDSFLHSEKDKKSSESQREAEAQAERERQENERKQKDEQAQKDRELRLQQQRALEQKEADQRREAEIKRRELEARQKAEAEQRRREADQKRKEIEQRQRMEAEQKARMEAEMRRQEAEAKARAEAAEKARLEAEEKARIEAESEQKRKEEEERQERIRLEEERRQRELEEQRRREEAERKRQEDERRRREEEEAERRRIEEEERLRREKEEEEERLRKEAEAEERRRETEREIQLQKQIQEELAMKRDEEQKRQQQLRLEQQLYEQRQQEQRKLQLGQVSGTSNRPARQNSLMGFQSFNGFRSNTPNGQETRALTPTGQAANGHQNGIDNPAIHSVRSGTPTGSQAPTMLPAVLRVGMDSSHTKSRSNSKDSNTGIMSHAGVIPPKSTLRVDTYDKPGSRGVTPIDHSPISPMEENALTGANGHDENDRDSGSQDLYHRDSPMGRSRPSLNGGPSSVLAKSAGGSTRRPSREVGNAAQRRFPIKADRGDKPERSSSMESRASRATANSAQSSKASLAETIDRLSESPEEEESHVEDSSLNSSRAQSFEASRGAPSSIEQKRISPERNLSNSSSTGRQPYRLNSNASNPVAPPKRIAKPSKVGTEVYNTAEFQQILNELRANPLEKPDADWDDEQYQKYLDDESGEIQEMLGRIYDIPEDVKRSFENPTTDDKIGNSLNLAMKHLEELESRLDKVFQDFFIETAGVDPFQEPDAIISPEERKNRDKWIEDQKKKLGTNDVSQVPMFRTANMGQSPYESGPFPKPNPIAPPQSPPQGAQTVDPSTLTSPIGQQPRAMDAPGRYPPQKAAAQYQSYMNQPHPHQVQQQQRSQQQPGPRVTSPVQYQQQQAHPPRQGSRDQFPTRQPSQDQYGQQQYQQRPQLQQQQYSSYSQQQQKQQQVYGSYRGFAPSAPPISAPPAPPPQNSAPSQPIPRPRNRS